MGLRRRPNQLLLLLLLLLLLAAKSISGQSLQGGYHTCGKDQEGTYVRAKISGGIVAHCKCVRGILDACQIISGAACEKRLKGCHFVEKSRESICQLVCRGCEANIGGNITKVESGQTWRDGDDDPCLKSHCFSGVVTKSQVQCPPPTCANPVKRPGQCCPTCPSDNRLTASGRKARCMRAMEPFADGETKADPLDPCNECTCDRSGRLTCERRACPVLPCQGRLQRTEKGQCCPTCVRRHDSDSHTFGPRCFFQNRLYDPEQGFQPDNCTNCTCNSGGAVSCFRRTCPALPCSESEQVRDEDSCCPRCPNAAFTSTRILPATRPDHCEHGGVRYADGATWSDKCANCSCAGGEIQCAKKKCPRLYCPGNSRIVGPLEGKCCQECKSARQEGVCTVFGDPHYRTFDGSIFNFQGSCKYLLASDCQHGVSNGMSSNKTFPGRPSFSIRITNDARNSVAFSWLRTVTVRLESGDKITLMQNMKVKVNGDRVDLPHLQMGAFSIMKDGGYTIILRLTNGKKLEQPFPLRASRSMNL